jgi:PAS domain S-box-containing protein
MPHEWDALSRTLLDAAPAGMVVCDQQGAVVLVNREAERLFGYQRDELIGQSIDLLIPDHARQRHHHHFVSYTSDARSRSMGANVDLGARRKDGSELAVDISLSPVSTERGPMFIACILEVTDRRQLEHENKRATAYLLSAMEAVREAFLLLPHQAREGR